MSSEIFLSIVVSPGMVVYYSNDNFTQNPLFKITTYISKKDVVPAIHGTYDMEGLFKQWHVILQESFSTL